MASKIAKGISATIVTVEDIYADYQGRDNQEQIRNFIRDAYENWETRYVLLGGDGDGANVGGESENAIVPTRELYAPIYPVLDPEGGDFIAADLYYACLDGSFDYNNNNIFGEIGDGYDIHPDDGEVDLFAEVYVGRAPVDNATELSNFVRKTLAYENTDDTYLENVRMVGELLFDMILGLELKVFAKPAKDEIKDGTPITVGIPREKYNVSTLYDDEGSLQQETIDLTLYARVSPTVRIGFRLQSDELLNYSGLYIDDVNVTGDGTPLFVDDMEHGENGWTHFGAGDEWELGIPFTGALQAHSGIYCWGTNLDGSYENLCDQRLVSPPIDLSSVTTAELSFYRWSYTEEGYDYGYVELSTDDGQSWTTLKNYTGGWTKDDLAAIINDGVHVINHLGHCNNFHLMRFDEPVHMRIDDVSGEEVISGPSHDIQNLTNDYPCFVYSQGCYPGAFDDRAPGPPLFQNPVYYPYDCIGEHLVTSVHGAFACVLNSRYGLGAANPRQGPSQYFDREFFDALYGGENKRNLGIANQDSKEDNIGILGMDGIRYCYYQLNLLGDPEVAIKDPVPRDHDIAVTKLNATAYMKVHTPNSINATIHNSGKNLETDISVQFCVNGQLVEEQVIPSLAVGQSVIVTFDWTPHTEGDYLIGIRVSPLEGETMLYNNQMQCIVHVCSNDAVYVCVLDSFAAGLGHGICDTLNKEWETYGPVPVVIDYTTLVDHSITYDYLSEVHPDVLFVSTIMPLLGGRVFGRGELKAIVRYVNEGHGLIAAGNPFAVGFESIGWLSNNSKLLQLLGIQNGLKPISEQTDPIESFNILFPDLPLFRNITNPYVTGNGDPCVPRGYGSWWAADDLTNGIFVAKSDDSRGVIVVNSSCVYISTWIDGGPNTNDLQLLYNAILWAHYCSPPTAPTGLTALPGDIFVNLQWTLNPEENIFYYSIYSSTSPDTGFKKIAEIPETETSYQDTERFMDTTYYYKITATNLYYLAESEFSSTISATPHRPIRGDANNDGVVNVADIVYLINYLFVHGPAPFFLATADVNNDGTFGEPRVDIVDVVYLINYLFINGPPPVYLNWPNYPPRARAGDNQTCLMRDTVYFDGGNSYDLDGTIVSYEWDFGDSSPMGSGMIVEHCYTTNGTFTAMLTVTDDDQEIDENTTTIQVLYNDNPQWQNQGQNKTIVVPGDSIGLSAQGKDDVALQWAWLSTNETGPWLNFSGVSWWDTNWLYRKKISIDHTKVQADLQNFPVLISVTSPSFTAHAQTNGDDFVFIDSTNTTKLNHEIESYNSVTGELVAWVNIPLLSSIEDTVLCLYYGNPSCGSQQNVVDTWNSDFLMVHHMTGAAYNQIKDSTVNHWDITSQTGSPSFNQAGWIGNCTSFSSSASLQTNLFRLPTNSSYTASAWVRVSGGINSRRTVFESQGYATSLQVYMNNQLKVMTKNTAGSYFNCDSTTSPNIGTWYYVCQRVDNTSHLMGIFVNGVIENFISFSGSIVPETQWLNIGKAGNSNNYYMNGRIDELRVSNIPQSNAWIQTEYEMMSSPQTFITVGSEQQKDGGTKYGSPMDMHGVADQWAWSNFTWQNPEIPEGTIVGWRIYYFDSSGNQVMTDIMSFTISTTTNLPPSTPSNPTPPDGATDVFLDVPLIWDPCTDPNGDQMSTNGG
jgi:hypothetical protein